MASRLIELLDLDSSGHRVYDFSQVGLGPAEQWAIADVVAGADPDWVVIGLNLASLSPGWEAGLRHPELVGWIEPQRLPRSAALLTRMGLTLDEMAAAVALVRSGGEGIWRTIRHSQIRIERTRGGLLRQWGGAVAQPIAYPYGKSVRSYGDTQAGRARLDSVLGEQYAAIFDGVEPDGISLTLLGGAVDVLTRRGARVLVFVVPVNIEVLSMQSFYDEAGLKKTLKSLVKVVERAGGNLLDLHDVLPEEGFRDVGGHLMLAPIDGPRRIAESLAGFILAPPPSPEKAAN